MNGRAFERRVPQLARKCLPRCQASIRQRGLHGTRGAALHPISVDRHWAAGDAGELRKRLVEPHGRDRDPDTVILTIVEAGVLRAGRL